jgi:hypothetical protein
MTRLDGQPDLDSRRSSGPRPRADRGDRDFGAKPRRDREGGPKPRRDFDAKPSDKPWKSKPAEAFSEDQPRSKKPRWTAEDRQAKAATTGEAPRQKGKPSKAGPGKAAWAKPAPKGKGKPGPRGR